MSYFPLACLLLPAAALSRFVLSLLRRSLPVLFSSRCRVPAPLCIFEAASPRFVICRPTTALRRPATFCRFSSFVSKTAEGSFLFLVCSGHAVFCPSIKGGAKNIYFAPSSFRPFFTRKKPAVRHRRRLLFQVSFCRFHRVPRVDDGLLSPSAAHRPLRSFAPKISAQPAVLDPEKSVRRILISATHPSLRDRKTAAQFYPTASDRKRIPPRQTEPTIHTPPEQPILPLCRRLSIILSSHSFAANGRLIGSFSRRPPPYPILAAEPDRLRQVPPPSDRCPFQTRRYPFAVRTQPANSRQKTFFCCSTVAIRRSARDRGSHRLLHSVYKIFAEAVQPPLINIPSARRCLTSIQPRQRKTSHLSNILHFLNNITPSGRPLTALSCFIPKNLPPLRRSSTAWHYHACSPTFDDPSVRNTQKGSFYYIHTTGHSVYMQPSELPFNLIFSPVSTATAARDHLGTRGND